MGETKVACTVNFILRINTVNLPMINEEQSIDFYDYPVSECCAGVLNCVYVSIGIAPK